MNARPCLRHLAAATFAAAIAAAPLSPMAEDIDIFTAAPPDGAKPNVLIVLDNSSNWSHTLGNNSCMSSPGGNMNTTTMFSAEMCALYKTVNGLNDQVRLGLMMFAETGNNGAYVRYAIRDMTPSNKQAYQDMLKNMVSNGNDSDVTGSNQPYGKTMFEVFKYFGGWTDPANATHANPNGQPAASYTNVAFGATAYAGGFSNGGNGSNSGVKRRDYRTNNGNRSAVSYGADSAFSAFAGNNDNDYVSPITVGNVCAKNFVIFISNGNPGTGGDSGNNPAPMDTIMSNIHVSPTALPTAATETHASKMDEMARYLATTDVSPLAGQQKITTYTIAVYTSTNVVRDSSGNVISETISNTDQGMIALMKSAAAAGGGKYFAGRDADSIAQALFDILNEVQAVNSVFVSASLPVSVNNQGTFLNQVYMGMFRPDGSGNPRWLGNLKEYKFKLDSATGSISLADANNVPAVNPSTGFISPSATSFWSRRGNNPAVAGWPNRDFWINNPAGTPPSAGDTVDATHGDGEVVEKGGASEMQRLDFATSQTTRNVFTCLPAPAGCSGGVAPVTFDNTTILTTYAANFGVTATELPLLVNWIRGQDNKTCDPTLASCTWSSGESGPGLPATVRPSIHGDVLHSRPVVLNYPGDPTSDNKAGPWIFYGSNDGMLRAVKGGQENGIPKHDGHEAWAFVAPEFWSRFNRLRRTSPELRTATNLPGTLPKDYFFDGPIGVWEEPQDPVTLLPTHPKKWIFATARRGGAVIYAFDVTDPENPLFMWRKTSNELPSLGQTWSIPWAFVLPGRATPFLVFGAGYDVGQDATPATSSAPPSGRGIYVLDASDGTNLGLLSTGENGFNIVDPIASDISLLVDNQGHVYRGYVGDTAGNVWRLDIPDSTVSNWKIYRFATLGPGKKFFFAPDIVHAGNWDVVLTGTGDREKPLVKTSQDTFFALNDRNAAVGVPASFPTPLTIGQLTQLTGTSGITSAQGAACTGASCVCQPPACLGWYRNLAPGEKVVNSPLTVAGTTYFSTNVPAPPAQGTCDVNLGEARAYGLTFFGGAPNKVQPDGTLGQPLKGGGLPPSPVGGVVTIEPGKQVAFIIGGGDKGSPVEGGRITIPVASTRRKVYWNSATDQ